MHNRTQTRTAAMELTLHRLQNPGSPAIYDEIVRACKPAGVQNLMEVAIHLTDAMAAVLVKDCGTREEAIASLQQQLTKTTARATEADA